MATSGNQNRSNKGAKREKADWFEALCTMGEDSEKATPKGKTQKSSRATAASAKSSGASSRTRVKNRSDDPFEDTDIPPFDPAEESVADAVFRDGRQKGNQKNKNKGGNSRSRSAQGKKPSGSGRGGARRDDSLPGGRVADVFYFLQPYVIFVLGAFLAIEMLLSCLMSGGSYDWTRDTQPFRWLGYYLEYFLFGLLGYGAYLLPAGMMYLAFDRLRYGKRRTGKGIMASCIVILLPVIIHVCMISGDPQGAAATANIGVLYTTGAAHASGGVLPGLIGYLSYIGLGVIGTLIIGIFLLILLSVLLVGLTPAVIWEKLRDTVQQKRAQSRRERDREMELREERGLVAKGTSVRSSMDPEERRAAQMEERIRRKLDREQERMEQEALREAERSDRLEQAKSTKRRTGKVKDPVADEDEFDPVDMLIRRESDRKEENGAASQEQPKKQKKTTRTAKTEEPTEQPVPVEPLRNEDERAAFDDEEEVAMPDEDVPAAFEEVVDLPDIEEATVAKNKKKPRARAQETEAEREGDALAEDELNVFPAQTEIEMDLEAPIPEDEEITAMFRAKPKSPTAAEASDAAQGASGGDAQIVAADPSQMYEDMSGVDDEDDGVEVTQANGGVTIAVEKLSDEERARGETVITPEKKEEYARVRPYTFPRVDLLNPVPAVAAATEAALQRKAVRLRDTLESFRIRVEAVAYVGGPTVTRYEVKPAPGVTVASIVNRTNDIAMGLEAVGEIRMEAPIPGKNAVGIEVPNEERTTVYLRGLIDSDDFRSARSRVTCCLGEGVGGVPVYLNIEKMPHLLIAGATGTGKSVCINSLVMSLLYKAKPDEVKLLMIDPKTVEFSVYKDIPHLMAPIITDAKRAAGALNLAVQEMERRYELMRQVDVRKLSDYNEKTANDRYEHPYVPQLVIIIDELADLMMTAKNEVEASIVRLAQKARAAGIHLILGTQRPSVDVITGLIKANVPSRIAFTVTSQVDSRTILDNAGAEKLLGIGDMLYAPIGSSKPQRVQGCFVSDDEVEKIVDFIRRNNDEVRYDETFLANLDREAELIGNKKESRDDYGDEDGDSGDLDPKFYEALGVAVKNKRISTSLLQRAISVGYGRAAKILDQMEEKGFIGPPIGNKPRDLLISEEAYRELMMNKD